MTGKILIASVLASSLAALASATSAMASEAAAYTFDRPVAVDRTGPTTANSDLRKIAASQFDLFFTGEFASRTFSFFALPNELSDNTKLVLTMQTAISVAPEESNLVIKVNGTEVGTTKLAAGNPRRLEFSVPAAVIQPGYNAVSIMASQRHRVDCSIDATYELWTKIDPEQSGFVFTGSQRPGLALVDLLAMSGTQDGKTSMRIVMPTGAQSSDYDRVLKVVQALAILGNFDHPSVDFGNHAGTGPGIDVYVGTNSQLGELLGDDHRALGSAEQMVVDATGDRRRLVLSGDAAEQLDVKVDQLLSLAETERPVGTADGLNALVNLKGRTMTPGQKTTLQELGFQASRFAGRHSVSQVNFTMPSDFYPGDYGSMSFYLSALYVGGLAPGAELLVKANEKVVASIPLSSNRAGEIRDQRLPIPFSVLRPGQNTFRIEARLPTRQDISCESVAKASSTVRLAISDSSYFDVENYARVGRYPDLAGLSSGFTLNKTVNNSGSTYLFVPQGDPQGMNAAATFVAKMAYASRQIQRVEFTSILPVGEDASLIAFGSYNNLPSELTSRMNLDFVNIQTAAKASPFEVASLDTVPIDSERLKAAEPSRKVETLSEFATAFLNAPGSETNALLMNARAGVADEMSKLNLKYLPALLGKEQNELYSPNALASVVVAQRSAPTGSVWTVIAARNADTIAAQTDLLTDSNVWNRLGGAVQSFSETGQVLDQKFSNDEYLFQTQPITVTNARLVAAGWLANNAEIYVGALLAAAIMLGLGTFMVLVTGRRHRRG